MLDVIRHIFDPNGKQNHPGYGAGEETEWKEHHDSSDQKYRSLQLGPIPDCFFPESVDDAHSAVEQDDKRDQDLSKDYSLSDAIHHILR